MPPPLTTSCQEASVRTALQIELTTRVSEIRKFFASLAGTVSLPTSELIVADRSLPRDENYFFCPTSDRSLPAASENADGRVLDPKSG